MKEESIDSFENFLSEHTINLVDYILKIADEKTLKDEFQITLGEDKEKSLLYYLIDESYSLKDEFIEFILFSDIEEDSDVKSLFSCSCDADSYGYSNSLHVLKFGNHYLSINLCGGERLFDISNELPITYCLESYKNLIEHMEVEIESFRENKDYIEYSAMGIEWNFDLIYYAKEKDFITKKEMSDYREFDNTINSIDN